MILKIKNPNLKKGKWISRNIIFNGKDMGISTVRIDSDNTLKISSFEREEEGTVYVSGPIVINTSEENGEETVKDFLI